MTTMTHDGYVATVELDEEAGLFHGEVINTRDVLTFQGRTLDELKVAFADTIADYIDWCRERGKEPQRPYSGNFTVRISPELHRRVLRLPPAAASASTSSWRRRWSRPPNQSGAPKPVGSNGLPAPLRILTVTESPPLPFAGPQGLIALHRRVAQIGIGRPSYAR